MTTAMPVALGATMRLRSGLRSAAHPPRPSIPSRPGAWHRPATPQTAPAPLWARGAPPLVQPKPGLPRRPAHQGLSRGAEAANHPRAVHTSAGGEGGSTAAEPATWDLSQWKHDGHNINFAVAGDSKGPAVVLVHGFGASVGHWRNNIPVLAEAGYRVYAVDLLGFGASEKPIRQYTMEGWRDQLLAFMDEVVDGPAVVVGNSIGSLATLMTAASAPEGAVRGVVLVNCAGGMNNKAVSDDWRIKVAMPIFKLIDLLLNQPRLARTLFDKYRSRDNIRNVLQAVYVNKASVDDELVDIIYGPSEDENALETFVSIITGPPGPRPQDIVGEVDAPILLLWGDEDPFTPLDGPVGQFFLDLPSQRDGTEMQVIPGAGHCPHDDTPEAVHERLLPWLAALP